MTNLSSIAGFSSGGGGAGAGGSATPLVADTPTSSVQVPIHAATGTNRSISGQGHGWIGGQCTNGVLKSRNTFGHWVHYSDDTAGAFKQGTAMTPITVNRSTGAITVGTPQDVWVNTNVATGAVNYNTTLIYEPVHGCFINSGIAGWDTSSSTEYAYGHAYGQLQTDGTVTLQASTTNNASATMNKYGSRCIALPQGTGTQHTIHPSNYSYGSYYKAEATSTGWQNVGSTTFPHTGSYSYFGQHYYQPDIAAVDTTLPASVINMQHSASTYGYYVNHNGTVFDVDAPNNPIYAGVPEVFLRDDKPIVYYNNSTSIFTPHWSGSGFELAEQTTSSTSPEANQFNQYFHISGKGYNQIIGMGANRYLMFGQKDTTCNLDYGEAQLIGVKADYSLERLAYFSVPDPTGNVLTAHSYMYNHDFFTVYENDTDANPKWLITLSQPSYVGVGLKDVTAESYEITADLTAYATST
tara:strand:+ start:1812 stop:3215 length:1404 start_codon:yes stop_codon:yes gene_type:complete